MTGWLVALDNRVATFATDDGDWRYTMTVMIWKRLGRPVEVNVEGYARAS